MELRPQLRKCSVPKCRSRGICDECDEKRHLCDVMELCKGMIYLCSIHKECEAVKCYKKKKCSEGSEGSEGSSLRTIQYKTIFEFISKNDPYHPNHPNNIRVREMLMKRENPPTF